MDGCTPALAASEKNMGEPLALFCTAITDDCRIRPAHISLYVALLDAWRLQAYDAPVRISRGQVMKTAKFSSRATYNNAVNELHEYGYIIYLPSPDPRVKSRVWLVF